MGKKFCNFYSPFPKSRCIIARAFSCFSSILIFQPFTSQKGAYRQTNSLRTVWILISPSFVNVFIFHSASILNVLFLQCGLQKYTFQVVSFVQEVSRESQKFSKLISLCKLHPRTKELCWRLLDSRLLAKTAWDWDGDENGNWRRDSLYSLNNYNLMF